MKDVSGSVSEPPLKQRKGKGKAIYDRVMSHAFETFGEESKAIHWLSRPNHLFAGRTPAEVLETEPESVEQELI